MALTERRHSPLRGRRLTLREALLEKFAASPLGYRYLFHVAPRIDRVLIPRTNGHWSSTGKDRVGILTTTGAKSGLERSQPVTMMRRGDHYLLAASNYGREKHPSWSTNLRANPECTITFDGETRRCKVTELAGEERAEAWDHITDFYVGYAIYEQKCAPRRIRVFRLDPVEG